MCFYSHVNCWVLRVLCMEGDPKDPEFIYKKLCIYSYMFKLQSPSKYSPFDAIHSWEVFFTAQNSFWTSWFWCLLGLLLVFISPLPHRQNISLWRLFSSRETKKLFRGRLGDRDGGTWGSCHFWSKTAEHSAWRGQVRCKSTITKRMNKPKWC